MKSQRRLQHPAVTYKLKTACTLVNSAGTLKVSKKICAAVSRFARGFSGASVSKTGCYEDHQSSSVSVRSQI